MAPEMFWTLMPTMALPIVVPVIRIINAKTRPAIGEKYDIKYHLVQPEQLKEKRRQI